MTAVGSNTISLRGISGASYEFWIYSWGQEFKAVGGVYTVLRAEGGSFRVLYIGQTGDLSERFENHHKAGCFDRNRKTHIAAMTESSESRRLMVEKDLIAGYNPGCNG